MKIPVVFCDAKSKWIVIGDSNNGAYKIEPRRVSVIKDCCDQKDIHSLFKPREVIPKGTKLSVNEIYFNDYGSFFRVRYKGNLYCINTKDTIVFTQPFNTPPQ